MLQGEETAAEGLTTSDAVLLGVCWGFGVVQAQAHLVL